MSMILERTCLRGLAVVLLCLLCSPAWGGDISALTGKIVDTEGRAVEGARVFVYDSPEVRRSADYISAPTDNDGSFRMVIVPGRYWAIARLKKAKGFGPLMVGDKHSGEAAEIEIAAGREMSMVFTIADLTEARRMKSADRERPVKLTGRILDGHGSPAPNAYVIANRLEKAGAVPDYLSAWTGDDGQYTLYIPRGTYYLGSSAQFPPDRDCAFKGPVSVEADRSDFDIAICGPKRSP